VVYPTRMNVTRNISHCDEVAVLGQQLLHKRTSHVTKLFDDTQDLS
jgi:hypothetical protein